MKNFEQRGFVSLAPERILSDELIQRMLRDLEEIGEREDLQAQLNEFHSNEAAEGRLWHALGVWRVSEAFREAVFNRKLADTASELLGGGRVRLLHDQVFWKPAGDGAVVSWHRDYDYWRWTKPMQHISCWVPLDDADATNGAITFIPGTHRQDLSEAGRLPLSGDMAGIDEELLRSAEVQTVPRGSATFHHALLVHGSYGNSSERPRRALVINYMLDGTLSNMEEVPIFEGYAKVPQGQPMAGESYPLLN